MKGLKQGFFLFFTLLIVLFSCKKESVSLEPPRIQEAEENKILHTYMEKGSLSPIQYYNNYIPSEITEGRIAEGDAPFELVDYGPRDQLPSAVFRPQIFLLFSQPVVPLSALGKPSGTNAAITITPAINGTYRWYGSRLLALEAEEDLIPQREYTVTVRGDIKSLGGKSYTGIKGFTFKTEPLAVQHLFFAREFFNRSLQEVSPEQGAYIGICFNFPVEGEYIKKFLVLSTEQKMIPFTLLAPEGIARLPEKDKKRVVLLHPEEPLPENSTVSLKVLEGASSSAEDLPIALEQEVRFSTLTPFRVVEWDTYSYTFPASSAGTVNPLYVTFSHPPSPRDLVPYLSTSLGVDIKAENLDLWDRVLLIKNLPAEPETEYTLTLKPGLRDIHGRALEKEEIIKVKVPEARAYAYFPNTGTRFLESLFPKRIVFEYQNIFNGDWKINSISDPYNSFSPEELNPYDFSRAKRNVRHFETLDLSPYLDENGKGFVGISWNFQPRERSGKRPAWGQENLQLQVTDLGLTLRYGYNRVVALVSSLSTGKPQAGVRVSLMRENNLLLETSTGSNGLAVFPLDPGSYRELFGVTGESWRDLLRIMVDTGQDKIIFQPNASHDPYRQGVFNTEYPTEAEKPKPQVFFFTDRNLYRPGEELLFRGIDKILLLGSYIPYTGPYTIKILTPYEGTILGEFKGNTSDSGGFSGSFSLPAQASPGFYDILYQREDLSRYFSFRIAEYRPVSFSVNIHFPDRKYISGQTLSARVQSSYLSGGFLAEAGVQAFWFREAAQFSPVNRDLQNYTFGPSSWDQRTLLSTEKGVLNHEGLGRFSQTLVKEGIRGLPYEYTLEARVLNQAAEEVTARKSILIHPASFYLGVKFAGENNSFYGTFAEEGRNQDFEYRVVTPESETVAPLTGTLLTVELLKEDWRMVQQEGAGDNVWGRYEQFLELEDTFEIPLAESGKLGVTPKSSGSYLLRLSSQDDEGRPVVTELSFYVTGKGWIHREEDGDLSLVPDKEVYSQGETAKVLIKTPLPQGYYLITVEREGILEERVEYLSGGSQVIGVPIREGYLPGVYLSVSSYSVRTEKPSHTYFTPDLDKPKGYYGVVYLPVDLKEKRIDLEIETSSLPPKPGEEVEVVVKASQKGRPLSGVEVTFLAVDRGVLDLTGYEVPNPLEFFWGRERFPLAVWGADSRSLLIDPVTYEVRDLVGGDYGGEKETATRSDFRATAVFIPRVITDQEGKAVIRFKLPDSITAFRCTALAMLQDQFGLSDKDLPVGNPLAVRPLVPRRMRIRDTALVGVLVSNDTGRSETVTVLARAEGGMIDGDSSREILLSPGQSREVVFPLLALEEGRIKLEFLSSTDTYSDLLKLELVAEAPEVFERRALSGTVEEGFREEGIVLPDLPDTKGSLTLSLSPGWAASLLDASDYLITYPYKSSEAAAGAVTALLLYGSLLEEEGSLSPGESEELLTDKIEALVSAQLEEGGFPFWLEGEGVSYYPATIKVAQAVAQLNRSGISLPAAFDPKKLLNYLASPPEWAKGDDYLFFHSLYTRILLGEKLSRLAETSFSRAEKLGIRGYALLGLSYLELGNRSGAEHCFARIKEFTKLTTRGLEIADPRSTGRFYRGSSETLALVLLFAEALGIEEEFLDRAAFTLLEKKSRGYWENPSSTSWTLKAYGALLDREARAATGRVSLGASQLLTWQFNSGDSPFTKSFSLSEEPFVSSPRNSLLPLRIEAAGEGRILYSVLLSYTVPLETLFPRDEGIGLFTQITNLLGEEVEENRLKLGETYRYRVILSSPMERDHLLLRIPLPSGSEAVDTSFSVAASFWEMEKAEKTEGIRGFYSGLSPREEIRDNEVRYYFPYLPRGKREVEFYFRATVRGIYPTPPVTAESLSQPEIFGRTGGVLFLIER